MSGEERARFLEVLSIDSVSSMQSEIAAICIATSFKILFYDQRLLFDFGFNPTGPPPDVSRELMLMLLALALEGVSDCIAMVVQTKQGLRLHPLWAGHRRWEMGLWLLLSQVKKNNNNNSYDPTTSRTWLIKRTMQSYEQSICIIAGPSLAPYFFAHTRAHAFHPLVSAWYVR